MTSRKQEVTDEEIRNALEARDEDYQDTNEQDSESKLSYRDDDIFEVNSDVDDEQEFSGPEDNVIIESEAEETYFGKDGTEWKSNPYAFGRLLSQKIVRGAVHTIKLPPGYHVVISIDAFTLFISDNIIKIIVNCTNLCGSMSKGNQWKPSDKIEIHCFIGLLMHAGANKQIIMNFGIHCLKMSCSE